MKKIKAYFENVYSELKHKVTWPTWETLQSSAIVVMIASAIIGIVIGIMDFSFKNLMDLIYKINF
jgi:preprotein translocase subunit SecE